MIKPIKITPVDTTKHLEYKCSNCGKTGSIYLENSIVNVTHDGKPIEKLDDNCPTCGKTLDTDK